MGGVAEKTECGEAANPKHLNYLSLSYPYYKNNAGDFHFSSMLKIAKLSHTVEGSADSIFADILFNSVQWESGTTSPIGTLH